MTDSLQLAGMMVEWGMDLLHISCWDAFTGAQGDPDDPRTITRRFREALGDEVPMISTGAVWDSSDAQFLSLIHI